MAYCRNCGSEIDRNDENCFECGHPNHNPSQKSNLVTCPHCESDHVQFVTKTEGSDYDAGTGCCGYILFGPLGLLCGLFSDKKTTTVRKCMNCNREF